MATIPSTYQNGDKPTAAQWNAPALALKGFGVTDDNAGRASFPISMGLPLPIRLSAVNETCKIVGASATYTVPAAKIFIIRNFNHAASVTDSITPSGGSAHNLATSTAAVRNDIAMVLGPGDTVTTGAGSYCSGILLDLPASVTTVCSVISNTVTYTVAANKRLVLLSAYSAAGASTVLNIDTITALIAQALDVATTGIGSMILTATQVLAANTAANILITGILIDVT